MTASDFGITSEQFARANRWRVLLVVGFVVVNVVYRVIGIAVPATVFLTFGVWIAIAGVAELVRRRLRSAAALEQLQVLALLADVTMLTIQHFHYSFGWWIGALFYALIALSAQSLVSRDGAQLVTGYALIAFNALIFLQATGRVAVAPFLPVTPLEGRFNLAVVAAITGTAGVVALAQVQQMLARTIRRSEERYRLLLETASDMIFTVDPEGRLLTMNRAVTTLSGYAPEEIRGKDFLPLLLPEDRDKAAAHFRATLEGAPQRYDVRYYHRDGSTRWISCVTSPIQERGVITGVLAVARDTTEERAREHQLRQTERLASLGTLVGGVAHELNNPLTGIKCFAQMLLEDGGAADDRESLAIIQREADRAAKIVSDLRLVARQTYDGTASERSRVDLNDIVDHVLKLRRYSLETRGITVRAETAPGLATVEGNRAELEQVLVNLVVNAEQAMEAQDGTRLLILRTRPSTMGVSLQVVDSGPGIAPEHLGRIFDPFFTTKSPGEGTGLGLSLAHSIVVEHQGVIRADSTLGRGAVFTIEFPTASSPRAPAHADQMLEPALRSLRVLVVDDEESIRRSLVRFLQRRGHTVEVAASGLEALQRIDDAPVDATFDVVLTDLRMPELGGDQLFRLLRARGRGLERRLVFVTGDSATSSAHEFLVSTGQPVLMKPFALEELAHVVESNAAA